MPRGRRASGESLGIAGLDELVQKIGQQLGEQLGAALVAGITSGVQRAGGLAGVMASGRASGRAPAAVEAGGANCRVPNCGRRAVAKGLCATHYRKARRLKLGDDLDASALNELAEDARKTRFTKGKRG